MLEFCCGCLWDSLWGDLRCGLWGFLEDFVKSFWGVCVEYRGGFLWGSIMVVFGISVKGFVSNVWRGL